MLRQGVTRLPAITVATPPPGTVVPGGTEEPYSVTYVELHPLRWNGESREDKQHQATGKSRPQRSTIPIAYLHNQSYYTDPNPSSVCFQRQHQGELCPSSHACSNSTYNTNNNVLETEGTTGTGLLAERDILHSKPAEEVEIAKLPLHEDCHQDPNTGGPKISACTRPKEALSAPTVGLPTPMH